MTETSGSLCSFGTNPSHPPRPNDRVAETAQEDTLLKVLSDPSELSAI